MAGSSNQCTICQKIFSRSNHLKRHLKNVHKQTVTSKKLKGPTCPVCNVEVGVNFRDLRDHLEEAHQIHVEQEEKKFASVKDFLEWKSLEEKETRSFFIKSRGVNKTLVYESAYYYCHRKGQPKIKTDRKRKMKVKGSNKTNSSCPAQMIAKIFKNKRVEVSYVKTHVGHSLDVDRMPLTDIEKKFIADKLAKNVPIQKILDDVRNSVTGNLGRIHLLTRQDILNIAYKFNLRSGGVFHPNDAMIVDMWVEKVSGDDSPVICYKPQGDCFDYLPSITKDDLLLVIMNPAQKEMLINYGKNIICIDSTRATNANNFLLTTIITVNDKNEAFPVIFILSNRDDQILYEAAFQTIKKEGVDLSVLTFMSDLESACYDAWINVFGKPSHHLWCRWHVDEAWRKNLEPFQDLDVHSQIYKILNSLQQEIDVSAFTVTLTEAVHQWTANAETELFAKYFEAVFSNCSEKWANCFRLWLDISTDMELERMHNYLDGEKAKPLDESIHALTKFVTDKQFDHLISLCIGNLALKQKKLRQRHETSLNLSSSVILIEEDCWLVQSQSRAGEFHKIEPRHKTCSKTCPLLCIECSCCLHQFRCSCIDNSIKINMCKHIHLICQKIKQPETSEVAQMSDKVEENLIIDEVTIGCHQEIESPLRVSSKENTITENTRNNAPESLRLKFAELTEYYNVCIAQGYQSMTYKIMSEAVAKLKYLINQNGKGFIDSNNQCDIQNKTVRSQRCLNPTKRAKISKNKHLKKPNLEEEIALGPKSLLESQTT